MPSLGSPAFFGVTMHILKTTLGSASTLTFRAPIVGDMLNVHTGVKVNIVKDRRILFKKADHVYFKVLQLGFEAEPNYLTFKTWLNTNAGSDMTLRLYTGTTEYIQYIGTILGDVRIKDFSDGSGYCNASWGFQFEVE